MDLFDFVLCFLPPFERDGLFELDSCSPKRDGALGSSFSGVPKSELLDSSVAGTDGVPNNGLADSCFSGVPKIGLADSSFAGTDGVPKRELLDSSFSGADGVPKSELLDSSFSGDDVVPNMDPTDAGTNELKMAALSVPGGGDTSVPSGT